MQGCESSACRTTANISISMHWLIIRKPINFLFEGRDFCTNVDWRGRGWQAWKKIVRILNCGN